LGHKNTVFNDLIVVPTSLFPLTFVCTANPILQMHHHIVIWSSGLRSNLLNSCGPLLKNTGHAWFNPEINEIITKLTEKSALCKRKLFCRT